MTSVSHIDFGTSVAPPVGARVAATSGTLAPDLSAPVAKAAAPPREEREQRGLDKAIDEQTLDRMALRLVKREPGLAIEKDETIQGYVYRFLDAESGDQIRQFPADKVLETMRALRQVSEHLERQREGDGVSV